MECFLCMIVLLTFRYYTCLLSAYLRIFAYLFFKYIHHMHWCIVPSDAIWWHGSKLVHVMAYCLKTRSHYLNQCRLISSVQCHSPEGNTRVLEMSMNVIITTFFLNTHLKIKVTYPRANELKCVQTQKACPKSVRLYLITCPHCRCMPF